MNIEMGKPLPNERGFWWNRDTETLHRFAKWKDDLPMCERVGDSFYGSQMKYIIWDQSKSLPWFGPLDLPTNPKGL